ncbi:Rz1-like lysis system protein LysC [Phytohalomonas tamaricis]|uniref:Rz1-like lysis system protein LysC n=1 Tax=Phytohalomonas tamaricis TaxID=2081032 RepID=UPI00374E056D
MPLSACTSTPPTPAPTLIINQCATPSPCTLPASNPNNNGDLNLQLEQSEVAWAQCAVKVDTIINCHANAQQEGEAKEHVE